VIGRRGSATKIQSTRPGYQNSLTGHRPSGWERARPVGGACREQDEAEEDEQSPGSIPTLAYHSWSLTRRDGGGGGPRRSGRGGSGRLMLRLSPGGLRGFCNPAHVMSSGTLHQNGRSFEM
jgi:hypothetical protein